MGQPMFRLLFHSKRKQSEATDNLIHMVSIFQDINTGRYVRKHYALKEIDKI